MFRFIAKIQIRRCKQSKFLNNKKQIQEELFFSSTSSSRDKVTQEHHINDGTSTFTKENSINTISAEDRNFKVSTDSSEKLKREPLVKNFFVGVVDRELLAYPEVITRDNMSQLENEILPFKSCFGNPIDLKSPAVMDHIRELGLYGINVPREYKGKGWNVSATLMASEPEARCTDAALNLLSHRVVIDMLNECGSSIQQKHFLEKLAEGNQVATEAVFESNVPDDGFFNTTASYEPEIHQWVLNGEKSYVVTGPLPTGSKLLLLVIAQTKRSNMIGDNARGTTTFLVDSTIPGVELGLSHATFGCHGVEMRQIKFKNVMVHESCVIGLPHDANVVADILLRAGRLRQSAIGLGIAKEIVNEMGQYIVNNTFFGLSLSDTETMQISLSKAHCATYAMESMIYLTAGLLDEFQKQDVFVEAAITKYYTLNRLLKLIDNYMELFGPKTLHKEQPMEKIMHNAAQLYTQNETIDCLRLYIGASGLQHAGTVIHETVRKSRNPLLNPGHILGRIMSISTIEHPKTKMRLGEHLHPSLEPAAQCIEHSVARLEMCVDLLLTRHGSDVMSRHSDLTRLAEISTTIYAMFASAARSSRSYCIGLQYADNELLTASSICSVGRDLVKILCMEIFGGEIINNDNIYKRLSKQLFRSKGYYAKHPLTYNF